MIRHPIKMTQHYYLCSSPIKEKNGKPTTGENVFPHKQTIRVNPNRGKQGGIPKKESLGIADPKGNPSWHLTELYPRCPRENSNEDPIWRQKGIHSEAPAKAKRNPREVISGDFHSKVRSELAPKGNKFRGA